MLSEPVPEKLFHQVRQQEFVRVIRIHVRQKEGVLPIPDQAVLGAVWEMQQDLLIREQGLQVVALIVTIVAFRILVAVHTLVAVVLLVIVRLTLTVVVFLVAVVLLAVPVAVFPVQVVAADRVPDKW